MLRSPCEREKSRRCWFITTTGHGRSPADPLVPFPWLSHPPPQRHRVSQCDAICSLDGDDADAALGSGKPQGPLQRRGHFLHGQQAHRLSRFHGLHRPLQTSSSAPEPNGLRPTELELSPPRCPLHVLSPKRRPGVRRNGASSCHEVARHRDGPDFRFGFLALARCLLGVICVRGNFSSHPENRRRRRSLGRASEDRHAGHFSDQPAVDRH